METVGGTGNAFDAPVGAEEEIEMTRETREIIETLKTLTAKWDNLFENGLSPEALFLEEEGLVLVPFITEDVERIKEVPVEKLKEAIAHYVLH